MAEATSKKTALDRLSEYEKTAGFYSTELRLSISDLIASGMSKKGWTQRQLAKESGIDEPTVSKVLSSGRNWSVDTIGSLLCAVGIHPQVVNAEEASNVAQISTKPSVIAIFLDGSQYGKEKYKRKASTANQRLSAITTR